MSKPRIVLLALIVLGILLEIGAIHGAYHSESQFWNTVEALFFVFLIVVPILVWRMSGERPLRVVLICTWAVYVILLCRGVYLVLTD